MTREELHCVMSDLVKQLQDLKTKDPEEGHIDADEILLAALAAAGFPEFRKPFEELKKWYA